MRDDPSDSTSDTADTGDTGDTGDKPHYQTSAADRAHGTHGKGDSREQYLAESPVEPGNAGRPESAPDARAYQQGQDGNLSDAAWGNAASGGSVIDKRSPKKK
jgi:hypothetical protein